MQPNTKKPAKAGFFVGSPRLWDHYFRGSGLVSRKGRRAAPRCLQCRTNFRGCFAALSRHKAAPTET
ncbi:hypothetical protein DBB42_19565 [Pseudomonas plecoglossicida]|uniref:Uncharacterized protein n=1 Tax=Pseudomonas plecoglossicida TaxID=70775 RepID=A0A2R7UE67_PSEDL|nr:hypothetical protein DBB42_19565 [Pseudomonas plecoglossicida]RFQ05060.1 hypothetical protein D0O09_04600 [Pseudomonas putida]